MTAPLEKPLPVAQAGRRGGYARAVSLTAKERTEGAKKAANARWGGKTREERLAEYARGRSENGDNTQA